MICYLTDFDWFDLWLSFWFRFLCVNSAVCGICLPQFGI